MSDRHSPQHDPTSPGWRGVHEEITPAAAQLKAASPYARFTAAQVQAGIADGTLKRPNVNSVLCSDGWLCFDAD